MFSKTEFNPSNTLLTQLPKELTFQVKRRKFWSTGMKSMLSNNSSKRQKISLHTHSMMDLLLPPELLTTVTSPQEQSRMSFADMPVKQVTMCLEDLVGIATVYLLNLKSIKNSESSQNSKFLTWESINTMLTAEESSWDTRKNGRLLLIDLQDGLILKKTTRPWILTLWSQSGTCSNNCLTKDMFIEEEKLCLGLMVATLSSQTSKFSKTTRKYLIHKPMSLSLW